jgi:SAM-dependent methyltransferase
MAHKWQQRMKTDWDAMARDNAAYYIYTAPEFASTGAFDQVKFFDSGRRDVDLMLDVLQVPANPAWTVLDIGCGMGRLTRRLQERYGKAIGVDVSAEMVAKARALNPDLEFQEVSGSDLEPFGTGTFDLVFSFIVLQHVPRAALVLDYVTEIARVLKPGGIAALQVSTTVYSRLQRARWNLGRARQEDSHRERASFRGSSLVVGELEKHAVTCGLTPEIVLYPGTTWTYYRLIKQDPASLLGGQRTADDVRPELARLKA